ncbi:nitrate/nitrite transporter, partial [Vibrio fluvialis]|nr:nitrate/nitrite transporter [Vibrio fluvialis]
MSINIDTKDMESSGRVSAHSIKQWFPEDRQFWLSQGQYIAKRNLWISIPC